MFYDIDTRRAPTLPNGIIQKYTVYRREIIGGQEVRFKHRFERIYLDTTWGLPA